MFTSKGCLINWFLTSSCWIFALSFCNIYFQLLITQKQVRKAPLLVCLLAFNSCSEPSFTFNFSKNGSTIIELFVYSFCRSQQKAQPNQTGPKGVFGTALLHVFQLHSTFFSQMVSAPRAHFEKKGWSCESNYSTNSSFFWSCSMMEFVEQSKHPLII